MADVHEGERKVRCAQHTHGNRECRKHELRSTGNCKARNGTSKYCSGKGRGGGWRKEGREEERQGKKKRSLC